MSAATEPGSYFVANYPPFARWHAGAVAEVEPALNAPPTDEPLGLYVLKEGFTPDFLTCFFRRADGNLYDGGFLKDVRTGDVHRHQVRSELNAVEPQGHGFRNLADEQGLCEAWNPHEQSVPTREQANRELFDHFSLTDDDFT
jgi:hypothetical protein